MTSSKAPQQIFDSLSSDLKSVIEGTSSLESVQRWPKDFLRDLVGYCRALRAESNWVSLVAAEVPDKLNALQLEVLKRLVLEDIRAKEKLRSKKQKWERAERTHDRFRPRASLLRQEFGNGSNTAKVWEMISGQPKSTCVDTLLKGEPVKSYGKGETLEGILGCDRKGFRGCLPRRKSKNASYGYKTFLKALDKRLARLLPEPKERHQVLLGLWRRAEEISPAPVRKAVARFVRQHGVNDDELRIPRLSEPDGPRKALMEFAERHLKAAGFGEN